MKRRSSVLVLVVAAVAATPAEAAKPTICTKKGIHEILAAEGKDPLGGVQDIRCGDVTDDNRRDAVFTLFSGGTAGATKFGVIRVKKGLILFRNGYKLGIDRVNSTRFDVQQPVYADDDPNCCPSSFRYTPWRWKGTKFRAGKSVRYKEPQKRFFA